MSDLEFIDKITPVHEWGGQCPQLSEFMDKYGMQAVIKTLLCRTTVQHGNRVRWVEMDDLTCDGGL